MTTKDLKECPFCGEPIRAAAIKCKHCKSMLERPQSPARLAAGRLLEKARPLLTARNIAVLTLLVLLSVGGYLLYPVAQDYIAEMERTKRIKGVMEKLEFVPIEGGCFEMGDTFNEGDSDEKPVHKVCLDDFHLAKHETTQGEWKGVMENDPSFFSGDDHPVEQVSWHDVQQFIEKLNERSDGKYRLPTEAEWEYACREGGKKIRFGNGKNVIDPAEANFDGRSKYKESYSKSGKDRQETVAVGSFAPNALGLHDMSGNVWEWVSDWEGEDYYRTSPEDNPKGPGTGSYRVERGGSWDSYPGSLRCANRYRVEPSDRYSNLGFRLARTP